MIRLSAVSMNFVALIVSALSLCPSAAAQQSSAASSASTDASRAEAVRFLSDLVKIDTSNPPGNEVKAANYIKSVLDKEGIASESLNQRQVAATSWPGSKATGASALYC